MTQTPKQRTEDPEVSIIIPAYRAAQYIGSALASAFSQTFARNEVIVINDGSPDTDDLQRIFSQASGPVIYIRQENQGPAAARNAGIRAARGRFIAFLDADDYWLPNYLSEQLAVFDANPSVDLAYADARLIGNPLLAGRTFMSLTPSNGKADLEALLTARCTVILSGTVARRQSLLEAGLFDDQFSHSEDYDLWLRLALAGAHIFYQKKVLIVRRELADSLCGNPVSLLRCQVRVLIKLLRAGRLTEGQRSLALQRINKTRAAIRMEQARACFGRGDFSRAARAIHSANRIIHSTRLRIIAFGLRTFPHLLLRIYNCRQRWLQSRSASRPAAYSAPTNLRTIAE